MTEAQAEYKTLSTTDRDEKRSSAKHLPTGTIVRLVSGGPEMCVVEFSLAHYTITAESLGMIHVEWFDKNDVLHKDSFYRDQLVIVRESTH